MDQLVESSPDEVDSQTENFTGKEKAIWLAWLAHLRKRRNRVT